MKKAILKTLSATLFLGVMFSSCLGDSSSKIENNNALAYIKKSEGRNVAMTNMISFTNDYVNTLFAQEFYLLDFSINTKDGINPDGSYIARQVGPSAGGGRPIVQGRFTRETSAEKPELYPTQMNVALFSPFTSTVDDKWVFSYECLAYAEDTFEDSETKKDNIRVVATIIDKDQMAGAEGQEKPIGNNKIVVRLYLETFENRNPDRTKDKVSHRGTASIDLTGVRRQLESSQGEVGKDGVQALIQFRYLSQKGKNEVIKDESLGSLSDERLDFFMVIAE